MKKVELLAPAGSFECLKAAISNGANAVYLGGKNFSARAFANNFDENEIKNAVKYAHERNVKVYVTLNTLLNENEFKNAIKDAEYYYKNNVDALLVQDLGLYYYLKKNFPDFELHCSTQMHVHNLDGIITAKKLGFKRVVVARESSLEFIKEACKQGIEIETFVHGAICVSYSGQCLMSSVTKNRSANKGMCAQCCRLKYDLYKDGNRIDTNTNYLLSPKDMCLIDDIPDLIEAGVSSFKIEGRLKSPAYVGYVTRLYRKAIDSYYNKKEYRISDEELDNLKVLFNRNFTNDYLYENDNLFGQKTPNHLGIRIGSVVKYEDGFTYIKLDRTLNQFDGIRINNFGCIVNMLYKDGLLVSSGSKNDIVYLKSEEPLSGDVYKTLDYELEKEIVNTVEKRIPIDFEVNIIENRNVKVTIKSDEFCFDYISDVVAQSAISFPLSKENIKNQFSKLNETPYYLNNIKIDTNNAFLPIKDLNAIRRDCVEKFNEYKLNSFKRETILPDIVYKTAIYNESKNIEIGDNECVNGKDKYDINYVINRESNYSKSNNAVICEIGGLLKEYKKKIAYYTLNCSNSFCYEFFKKIGFNAIILSSELKENEIKDLISAYKSRNSISIYPYVLNRGNRVLMYIKTNPLKEYMNEDCVFEIKDQNNSYYVRRNRENTEIIEENDNFSINKQVFTIVK